MALDQRLSIALEYRVLALRRDHALLVEAAHVDMAAREGVQWHFIPLRRAQAVREEHLRALLRDGVRAERFRMRAPRVDGALMHEAGMHEVDRVLEEHLPVAAVLEAQRAAESREAPGRGGRGAAESRGGTGRGAVEEVVEGAAHPAEKIGKRWTGRAV